ncbi:hypothetical protein [Campylobacter coli]|uniref:hypothetical protein n=1 Tax=Campylobacter coli TaxID=195 RepID=UPI0011AB0C19|nr:hypothetical protein [Campylobacter coli]
MNFKRISELLEIANNYNIEVSEVFSALNQALEIVLKCGKLHADFSNEKILFYELIYNRFGEKRKKFVQIKRSNYKAVQDKFISIVTSCSIEKQREQIKTLKSKVFKGKIEKVLKTGFEVSSSAGFGFLPKVEVLRKDLERMQLGAEIYFAIKKIKNTQKAPNGILIFTRKNMNILEHEIIDGMSDCGVYYIEKIGARKISIFCTKMPTKDQIKNIMRTANTFLDIQVRN